MAMRIAAFERELKFAAAAFEGDMRVEFPKAARAERDRLIASGQASPAYQTFVNGRAGALEEAVKLPGPIVYEFSYLTEAVIFCLAFLEARSPMKSGRYRRSMFVLANGREWDQASELPPDADVLVLSDQPYSRKIHVGATGFETSKGLFEQARQATRMRFQNVVEAYVTFTEIDGGYVLKGRRPRRAAAQNRMSSAFRAGRAHLATRSDTDAGKLMKYPAVRIITKG